MRDYGAKFAGSWYPGEEGDLRAMLKGFFDKVPATTTIPIAKGIIAPHAGYIYSGQTAAYGFKAFEKSEFDTAVILATSHREPLRNISTFGFSSISTPLGSLPVDTELNRELSNTGPLFQDVPASYSGEHSFELELPFIQYIRPDNSFRILPLIVGAIRPGNFKEAATQLKAALGNRKAIYIASSDFTHYGAAFSYLPFIDAISENLKKFDMKAIRYIEKNDIAGFYQFIEETGATICGSNAILLLMSLFEGSKGKLLFYTNSGELTGDYSHCVSYASLAFPIPCQ